MRDDDGLMVILTGIVLVIAVATFLPRDTGLDWLFGAKPEITARDDTFRVVAGRQARLNVFANDTSSRDPVNPKLVVTRQPDCGAVRPDGRTLLLSAFEGCTGRIDFEYCVMSNEICRSAQVMVQIDGPRDAPAAKTAQPALVSELRSRAPRRPGAAPQPDPSIAAPGKATVARRNTRAALPQFPAALDPQPAAANPPVPPLAAPVLPVATPAPGARGLALAAPAPIPAAVALPDGMRPALRQAEPTRPANLRLAAARRSLPRIAATALPGPLAAKPPSAAQEPDHPGLPSIEMAARRIPQHLALAVDAVRTDGHPPRIVVAGAPVGRVEILAKGSAGQPRPDAALPRNPDPVVPALAWERPMRAAPPARPVPIVATMAMPRPRPALPTAEATERPTLVAISVAPARLTRAFRIGPAPRDALPAVPAARTAPVLEIARLDSGPPPVPAAGPAPARPSPEPNGRSTRPGADMPHPAVSAIPDPVPHRPPAAAAVTAIALAAPDRIADPAAPDTAPGLSRNVTGPKIAARPSPPRAAGPPRLAEAPVSADLPAPRRDMPKPSALHPPGPQTPGPQLPAGLRRLPNHRTAPPIATARPHEVAPLPAPVARLAAVGPATRAAAPLPRPLPEVPALRRVLHPSAPSQADAPVTLSPPPVPVMAVGLSDTESPSPPLLQVPPVKLAALAAPATVAPAALESTTADKPAPRYAALMQDTPTAIDVPAVKPEGGRAPAFCAPRLSLLPAPAQSVTAILRAPCHAGRPVTFDHAGIRFTLRLDAGGRLQIRIPALESPARVTARLEDGLTASAQRNVAGLGRVARVALSWPGGVELNLRAREAILRRVAQSDVWQGAPRSPAEALREGGGYLIALGEPAAEGHLAEIYSWPLRRQDRRRIVPLVLELVTGPGNCRRPVRVTAVYADRPRRPERRVVVIANRRCAPGGIVLRNDGLRDLRLAGN